MHFIHISPEHLFSHRVTYKQVKTVAVERDFMKKNFMLASSTELCQRVEMTVIGVSLVSDEISVAQLPGEVATLSNQSFQLISFHLTE